MEHVRAATRLLATSENLHGGAVSVEAATGQLRWGSHLLSSTASTAVRQALYEAVGNLAGVAAFCAFDVADHRTAQRLFRYALWCADQGAARTLRATTLSDMARQAAYLGDTEKALALIEEVGSGVSRLPATAQAILAVARARLQAARGCHDETRRDVDRADESFARSDPAADPPWLSYYDYAEHQGSTGRALMPVAVHTHNLELAAGRLTAATRDQGPQFPRSRAFSLTRLATLLFAGQEPHQGAKVGHQAVREAGSLRSQRLLDELRSLAQTAPPYSRIPDVAQLQADIHWVTGGV